MIDQKLCNCQHVAATFRGNMDVTGIGQVQDRRADADLFGRRTGIRADGACHGIKLIGCDLESQIVFSKHRVFIEKPLHHPALAEVERGRQALGALVPVHHVRFECEFELGPAFMAVLACNCVQKVGVLRTVRSRNDRAQPGDGISVTGGERLFQSFGGGAQGFDVSGHWCLSHLRPTVRCFGHEKDNRK